jgi:hypothetical protein
MPPACKLTNMAGHSSPSEGCRPCPASHLSLIYAAICNNSQIRRILQWWSGNKRRAALRMPNARALQAAISMAAVDGHGRRMHADFSPGPSATGWRGDGEHSAASSPDCIWASQARFIGHADCVAGDDATHCWFALQASPGAAYTCSQHNKFHALPRWIGGRSVARCLRGD